MLDRMRSALGWGEPNPVHRWYSARNGPEFASGSVPWCQMTVTWAAYLSGNYEAVCPNGDRAYTVWGAGDGERLGLWHSGTAANIKKFAGPGAIVYFDWGGTNTRSKVDHVGVVERVLDDGRVVTIEGNTDNACKRRVRAADVIAGFWCPKYPAGGDTPPSAPTTIVEDIVDRLPMLAKGADNYDVKTIRGLLFARGGLMPASYPEGLQEWLERTVFDAALDSDVKAFQRAKKLEVDGVVGPRTWSALLRLS
ncbi:CHAP domain-containing protein [Nonomuraea sp. NPDC049646]|uniref:CHAP domain-containing protein n=1 Tax=unclassified Nonomuraea TaxID=2593643 RepID=UPI0037B79049